MEQIPIVSVILPVYNDEIYLMESVSSILSQSYTLFELIIIDDGSNDATKEIIAQCLKLDSRVKVLTNELNSGIVVALNKGIKEARGKYIARMDSDDISLTNRLERQVAFLDSYSSISIVGGGIKVIGETAQNGTIFEQPTNVGSTHVGMFFSCALLHPTIMGRIEVFQSFEYPNDYPYAEDYALWLKMTVSEDNIKMTNLELPEILQYRRHAKNSSSTSSSTQKESSVKALVNAFSFSHIPDLSSIIYNLLYTKIYDTTLMVEKTGNLILEIEDFLLKKSFTTAEQKKYFR
jgi:glycosyltransferase involved in cell wall biosynthesis